MYRKRLYRYYIYFISILFLGCNQDQKQLPPLNETFLKNDKKPFGSYVAYHHLKDLYSDRYIETINKSFDVTWKDLSEYNNDIGHSLYILITKNLVLNETEAEAMVSYIKNGNDLLLSADFIDNELLDRIDCREYRDSEIVAEVAGTMNETSLRLYHPQLDSIHKFGYYYYPFLNSFAEYDSLNTKILGYNQAEQANFLLLFIGKGRLYINAAPRAFSNYFLLTGNNYKYFDNVLSYVRSDPKNIFWDEYYKSKSFRKKNPGSGSGTSRTSFSSFNVINKNPPLLWAFWLSVITILLFILFNIKRKQRIINEVKPNTNTTVVFTETVGRLYLEKKNNKNIAEKMITYFYEHIRNKYFMNTDKVTTVFLDTLSRKSGVEYPAVESLFSTIKSFQNKEEISDKELLLLNRQMQNFNKLKADARKNI